MTNESLFTHGVDKSFVIDIINACVNKEITLYEASLYITNLNIK